MANTTSVQNFCVYGCLFLGGCVDSWSLELQTVVDCCVSAESPTWVFRASSALNCWAISLAPSVYFFKVSILNIKFTHD